MGKKLIDHIRTAKREGRDLGLFTMSLCCLVACENVLPDYIEEDETLSKIYNELDNEMSRVWSEVENTAKQKYIDRDKAADEAGLILCDTVAKIRKRRGMPPMWEESSWEELFGKRKNG